MPCQSGKFNNASRASACESCPAGTTSSVGASECDECSVGTYAETFGSAACTPCTEGTFASHTGSLVCQACGAGKASSLNGSACDECPVGKSADAGSSACEWCAPGTVATAQASSTCEACPAGMAANSDGTSCSSCSAGSFLDQGSATCKLCDEGKFTAQNDSVACSKCSDAFGLGYTSREGATSCEVATENYYWDEEEGEVLECPFGATCDDEGRTTLTIDIKPNHFRLSKYTTKIYECLTGNCLGGLMGNSTCSEGSGGVLCAVCDCK